MIILFESFLPYINPEISPNQPNNKNTNELSNITIPIYQIYLDSEYAWQKLLTRQDRVGPIDTNMFFGTEVIANVNKTLACGVELLSTIYSMYKITNNSDYLEIGWEMFQDIISYRLRNITRGEITGELLVNYNVELDEIEDSIITAPSIFVPIALEDPRYIPYFERIISGAYKLFWSPINLIYQSLTSDGSIRSSNCHITWGSSAHKKIMQLFWLYYVTGKEMYKNWGDATIEALWKVRSTITNLLPREIYANTGNVIDSSISHYDMTGWLSALELAYYICGSNKTAGTGDNTYLDLIDKTASGISEYIWNNEAKRWDYKANYLNGGPSSVIPEMNSIYVDYAMIRAYEITGKTEFLNKAIEDFNTCFIGNNSLINPNGVLIHNSLVIHSPNTLKYQSQMTGSSNIMVARTAYLIYLATGDESYLQKANYHYKWLMDKHRFEKGYTNRLNSDSLEPEGIYNGGEAEVYDNAPIIASLTIQNAFLVSEGVRIDWGFNLSSTSPNFYGNTGMLSGVEIDVSKHCISLNKVYSKASGLLSVNYYPSSIITSVKVDNHSYSTFTDLSVTTLEGVHSYQITFSAPNSISSESSTSTRTTTTASSITTKSSTTNISTDETSTKSTSGFLLQFIIPFALISIRFLHKRN